MVKFLMGTSEVLRSLWIPMTTVAGEWSVDMTGAFYDAETNYVSRFLDQDIKKLTVINDG